MREFAGEYGGGVRQENVRSKTKELTGTLPCALSMCPTTIGVSNGLCEHLRACEQRVYFFASTSSDKFSHASSEHFK